MPSPHKPGTLFVLRSDGFVPWAIRALTRSRVNHAGVCLGDGRTVESQAAGAVSLQERPEGEDVIYGDALYEHIEALAPGRNVRIAREARRLLGTPYNFLDIAVLAFRTAADGTFQENPSWIEKRIMREDRLICSQLTDLACQRSGVYLFSDGRLPGAVTPGDLREVLADPTLVKVEI